MSIAPNAVVLVLILLDPLTIDHVAALAAEDVSVIDVS